MRGRDVGGRRRHRPAGLEIDRPGSGRRSTSSRSTVPVITMPSPMTAAIGASASASGPNRSAKRGIVDHRAGIGDQRRAERRRRRCPAERSQPGVGQRARAARARRRAAARTTGGAAGRARRPCASPGSAADRPRRPRRAPTAPAAAAAAPRPAPAGAASRAASAAVGRRLRGGAATAVSASPKRRVAAPERRRPSIRAPSPSSALLDSAVPARLRRPLAVARAERAADIEPLLGAGHRDIEQPPMLLALEPVLRLDLRLERLGELVLARAEQRHRRPDRVRAVVARAACRASGRDRRSRVGEDHDRRLQALRAVHGHHPHRVERRRGIAHDLDVAAREPVEEALQRRRARALEFERAGEQFLDRIARLRAEPLEQLAPAVERPRQQGLEELVRASHNRPSRGSPSRPSSVAAAARSPRCWRRCGHSAPVAAVRDRVKLVLAPAEQGRDEQAGEVEIVERLQARSGRRRAGPAPRAARSAAAGRPPPPARPRHGAARRSARRDRRGGGRGSGCPRAAAAVPAFDRSERIGRARP